MKNKNIQIYFKGDSGIKDPIDMNGNLIKEGDYLTRDFGDYQKYNIDIKPNYVTEPFFIVKINKTGGFFAESIDTIKDDIRNDKRFYLHDFRFKFCNKIFDI